MKLFIWDFHGTLEQGNELAVLEISNIVLEKHGYAERLSTAQSYELYGRKWYEYFEYLLPTTAHEKIMELQNICFDFSCNHPEIIAKYIKFTRHATEVLETIDKSHDQILVSNTKPASLEIYLKTVGMSIFFPEDKTFATDSHTTNSTKLDVAKKYIYKKHFEEIIVVGDSSGDIELGHALKATTFLYAHPGQKFKPCSPHHKINDLRQVLKAI